MHKYYDGQMIIKWATATVVTKLECRSRDIQKFSNCMSLKNTPGQVGGVFKVVIIIFTSLGGPNEFIFFCYGISNKAWVYFFWYDFNTPMYPHSLSSLWQTYRMWLFLHQGIYQSTPSGSCWTSSALHKSIQVHSHAPAPRHTLETSIVGLSLFGHR